LVQDTTITEIKATIVRINNVLFFIIDTLLI
jgi:hypothetical protein